MTPENAIAEAKKGALRPFYLVTGPEQYVRDQVVTELRSAALGGGVAAFNEDKFTAGEGDVDRVLAAARTVPMMANRRFVLVRGAERWDAGASSDDDEGGTRRESPLDRLAKYANAPVDTTCVVVVAAKLDGRRKLAALAKKQDFGVQCEPLDARRLGQWVVSQFKVRGHAVEQDVAGLLAELAGPEMASVADAVERLSLFVGQGEHVTEAAVAECVARVGTGDTWALVAAIGKRDLGAALRILSDVYDPHDHGLPLLGAVAWSVRQLARLQAAMDEGMSLDQAAQAAGIYPPSRAREMSQKLKAFRPRELERWLQILAEADLALKSSRRPSDAILHDMLTRMCGR